MSPPNADRFTLSRKSAATLDREIDAFVRQTAPYVREVANEQRAARGLGPLPPVTAKPRTPKRQRSGPRSVRVQKCPHGCGYSEHPGFCIPPPAPRSR